jgi:hypothetical protein
MDWDDIAKLAADPNVTIGSATVNYPVLSSLGDALRRPVRHFAYPFGDRTAIRRRHVTMAQELGLASAATVQPAVVEPKAYTDLHALPRFAWDGRQRSLRMMRVLLSGIYFAPLRAKRADRNQE